MGFSASQPDARPSRSMQLRVLSDPAFLAPVRRSIETFSRETGFDEAAIGDIGLCVNEAMANITRHAYGGAQDRPVDISVDFDGAALVIKVRDWGSGVKPPIEVRHDPLKPGGVGMLCLKQLLDEFTFTTLPDGMLLKMQRKLTHGMAS